MYLCMYICMYTCMYLCMYIVCIHAYMYNTFLILRSTWFNLPFFVWFLTNRSAAAAACVCRREATRASRRAGRQALPRRSMAAAATSSKAQPSVARAGSNLVTEEGIPQVTSRAPALQVYIIYHCARLGPIQLDRRFYY